MNIFIWYFAFKNTSLIFNCATLKWIIFKAVKTGKTITFIHIHFKWTRKLNVFLMIDSFATFECIHAGLHYAFTLSISLSVGQTFYECYRLLLSLSSLQKPLPYSPIGSINFNFSTFIIINLRPGPDPDPVPEAAAAAEAGPGLHFKSTRHFRCWQ